MLDQYVCMLLAIAIPCNVRGQSLEKYRRTSSQRVASTNEASVIYGDICHQDVHYHARVSLGRGRL